MASRSSSKVLQDTQSLNPNTLQSRALDYTVKTTRRYEFVIGKWLLQKEAIKMSEDLRFNGTIKRLTCSKTNGKYYISLAFDINLPKPANNGKSIGLDWGLKNKDGEGNYFTGDQGQTFNLPELHALENELRFRQKQLSRKKRGSERYIKAKAKFDAVQERANNIKKDAQNKLVYELVNSYAIIAVEDISTGEMSRNPKNHKNRRRAILRYSNYEIREVLKRKAYEFRMSDRYCPTSQLCSACGERHYEMKDTKIRTLRCSCGLKIDRDVNAAINILKYSVAL